VPSDCVFCRIIAGTAPASVAYRDENVLAFLDIRPLTPGHLLVIPLRHAAHLADLDPDDGGRLFRTGQRLAAALRASGLRCEGVNFFLADGTAAGQEVFHVHLHVLPRYRGDGFRLRATFGSPSRPDLDRQAGAVAAALGAGPDALTTRG
jgi:histidine triad (HIT) family protein